MVTQQPLHACFNPFYAPAMMRRRLAIEDGQSLLVDPTSERIPETGSWLPLRERRLPSRTRGISARAEGPGVPPPMKSLPRRGLPAPASAAAWHLPTLS
jgi:hypothetical protein